MPNRDLPAARKALGRAAGAMTQRAARADANPEMVFARRLEAWVRQMHDKERKAVPFASLDASRQHPAGTLVLNAVGEERYLRLGIYGPEEWLQGDPELVLTATDPLSLFPSPYNPELFPSCLVAANILAAADGVAWPLARLLEATGKLTASLWLLEQSTTTWDLTIIDQVYPSPKKLLEHALDGLPWELNIYHECCTQDVLHWEPPVGVEAIKIPT
jgi:hypothetical protein